MLRSRERSAFWQQAPASVKLAVRLLNLQATIWSVLVVGLAYGDADVAITHPGKVTTTAFVATVLLALAGGTFAAGKFWLAARLPRGHHKTRKAVITVEELMAGFAGLILLGLMLSVTGVVLSPPIVIGGIMSFRAARGLSKPPARGYFDAIEAAPRQARPEPRPGKGGSPAQFRSGIVAASGLLL
jgi:hypothetical protein